MKKKLRESENAMKSTSRQGFTFLSFTLGYESWKVA